MYRVTWYEGNIETVDKVIDEIILEAADIDAVRWTEILPISEKKKFEISLKYCVRTILFSEKKHTIDYGSHSKFILVEEI